MTKAMFTQYVLMLIPEKSLGFFARLFILINSATFRLAELRPKSNPHAHPNVSSHSNTQFTEVIMDPILSG